MKRHEPSLDDLGIAESGVSKHLSTTTETARMSFLSDLTLSDNWARSEASDRVSPCHQHGDPAATADGHPRSSQLANTIAVVSAMGGVGRTSITANVAADLAAAGRRVLAVDLDTQGNLEQDLGYGDDADCDRGASLQELFTASTSGRLRILRGVRERLDVVCGGEHIGVAVQALPHPDSVHDGHTLTRALTSVADRYDIIIMDCPRQMGGVTLFALAAARGVIVPIRCADDLVRGLNLANSRRFQVLNELNPALSLLGVILSQRPAGATWLRSQPRDRLRRDHPDLHIFDAIIRFSALSAFDTRRLGVVAAEYEAMRCRGRSKAAAGLADDYHALASEIIDRLSAVNAKVKARDAEDSARAPMLAPPPRRASDSVVAPPTKLMVAPSGVTTPPPATEDTPDRTASTRTARSPGDPGNRRRRHQPVSADGDRTAATKVGVSVRIEPGLHEVFNSWKRDTQRSLTDCVLSAHLTHGEEIVERLRAEDDPVRAAYDLPRLGRRLVRGKEVGLWITREGLGKLDAAARIVRMSRRAYIHELLRVALSDYRPR